MYSFIADLSRTELFIGKCKFQISIYLGISFQDKMTGSKEGLIEKMREEEGQSLKQQQLTFPTL